MPTLDKIIDGAENDNFAAKHALWLRFAEACPDEAGMYPPVTPDSIIREAQIGAAIAWAKRAQRIDGDPVAESIRKIMGES